MAYKKPNRLSNFSGAIPVKNSNFYALVDIINKREASNRIPFRMLIEEKPDESVPRCFVSTLDATLNSQYRSSMLEIGVETYIIIYEGETHNGVRPHTFGVDGWPVVDIDLLKLMLEEKYDIQQNSAETKWVMIDYENVWLTALSTGDTSLEGDTPDTELLGPINRRATQEISDLFDSLKSYFGPNVKFTLYGCPRMYNFATSPVTIDAVQWAQATNENKEQRIANTVIQHKDVLSKFDWFSASTYDGIPSSSSLVENGGTVLQRANVDPYERDITGEFDRESTLDDDRWIGSIEATIRIMRENGDLGNKQLIPIVRTSLYTTGIHFRDETTGPRSVGPRSMQFIPNQELINRIVYGRGQILSKQAVYINGVCFWDAIDYLSSTVAMTTNVPSTEPSISNQTTFRGSIVRNFFDGTDPVDSGQYANWADSSLKREYAIRHNDNMLQLLRAIKSAV